MTQEAETLQEIADQKYKYGFVTDIESEFAPKGLNEDTVRFISAKKDEPEWMLEWRLAAYRRWLTMEEPEWARVHYPQIDYPGRLLLRRAQGRSREAEKPGRGRSRAAGDLREARHSAARSRRCWPASRWMRCSTRFRSPPPSRRSSNEAGVIFCPISEAIREYPELVKKYLGTVVPVTDNFFATLNSAVFSDGTFVYVPKGVRCPMELSTYFRINASEDRPVRAHADHRRRRRLCLLSRRLHRAQARREPAACRGGRAGGAGRCRDQIFHRAELVSGRREWQGRHLQFRHQARRLPRRATPRFPGRRSRPVRPSPGNIRAASCGATIRSANSIPSPSPTISSRPTPAPR